jgi:exopolyphosphatase/guanosine-5'-triphosphate,3'-diphosphate pyrophosphatase
VSAPADGRLAVVDVGSNSVRLFLCEGIGPEGPRGERYSTVTGLRRGAAADGSVAPDALARLDECLAGYAARVASFAPERVLPVATSAVRDAPNRDEVAAVVSRRLGAPMRLLSGEEEAAVAFAGARLAADGGGPILVLDVGGGSTELVRGGRAGPEGAVSLQLGAVRQTERHLRTDPPAPAELEALRKEALGLLRPAVAEVGGPAPGVGVAGTATSLAAIEIGRYDRALVHRHRLSRAGVEALVGRLAAMTVRERRGVPGLDPARAGVIVAGAVIVAAAMDAAGLAELMVSETDLLDGVALAASGRPIGSFRL